MPGLLSGAQWHPGACEWSHTYRHSITVSAVAERSHTGAVGGSAGDAHAAQQHQPLESPQLDSNRLHVQVCTVCVVDKPARAFWSKMGYVRECGRECAQLHAHMKAAEEHRLGMAACVMGRHIEQVRGAEMQA